MTELPDRWQRAIADYLGRPGSLYKQISLADFADDLKLVFEDGSNSFFKDAFYLVDAGSKEVAVFTEHCGYHIFPFCIETIEVIDDEGKVKNTNIFVIE